MNGFLHVPERDLPVPNSASPEAQEVLALGPMDLPPFPAVDDVEGWRSMRASQEAVLLERLADVPMDDVQVEERDVEGVRLFVITPPEADPDDDRVCLEFHGSLFMGGGACGLAMGIFTATRFEMPVWTPDYRMPPDDPYPAALDDCLIVYRALLRERSPSRVVVSGASGGGNLAAATILRAREEGFPLPAAALLLTPHVDLTQSGDTFRTNLGIDTVLVHDPLPISLIYAGGHDRRDPYVSPLFGDFSTGFPPTLLASGTRDLFLSSTVRMHRALRAAGVHAELHVFEASPHGGFMADTPEDEELDDEVRRFVATYCPQ